MENKYLKYGLIAGAILVWGAIVIRVVGGMSGPAAPLPQPLRQPVITAHAVADSFVLYADYPDPFLPDPDTTDEATAKTASPVPYPGAQVAMPAMPPPPPLKSMIQYVGLIANPKKKLKLAILNINGKEVLMREKEKKDDLLLIKIGRDKIIVEYKGRYGEIGKND